MSKIRAGRLRHVVGLYVPGGLNNYCEQVGETLVFEARAEVQVKSGNQLADFGTVLTSEVITVMMYYDDRALNNQTLKWDSKDYEVKHIRKDTVEQSMIITAERIAK